ncbi:MAG TPA: 30S ribosomal protein S1 [Clostridia bacterium]|nr:30S ribosomal protein S1 [Clostridia bacterium]
MTEEKMEDLMEEVENSVSDIDNGDVVKGKVISVNEKEVILDINYSSEGVLDRKELSNTNENPVDLLNEGDEIDVLVVELEGEEGNVVLSKVKADGIVGKKEIEAAFNEKSNITVKVFKDVKGGVLADYKGVTLFIPASLISVRYIEDLKEFVGETLEIRIEELDFSNNRIIGSRKAIEKEELKVKKAEILDELEKGDVIEGTVTRLANFGAFVDLGGIDGLIHISQMSWKRINHPKEILKEGQKVKVEVLKVNAKEERISLKLENFDDNPWKDIEAKLVEGQVVKGTIKRITGFGAFVEVIDGLEGLVHISQISDDHVDNVEDVLEVGQEIDVKVLNIKKDEERIGLSIKDTVEEVAYEMEEDESSLTLGDVFKDKLSGLKLD